MAVPASLGGSAPGTGYGHDWGPWLAPNGNYYALIDGQIVKASTPDGMWSTVDGASANRPSHTAKFPQPTAGAFSGTRAYVVTTDEGPVCKVFVFNTATDTWGSPTTIMTSVNIQAVSAAVSANGTVAVGFLRDNGAAADGVYYRRFNSSGSLIDGSNLTLFTMGSTGSAGSDQRLMFVGGATDRFHAATRLRNETQTRLHTFAAGATSNAQTIANTIPVAIQSQDFSGTYKVALITHNSTSYATSWTVFTSASAPTLATTSLGVTLPSTHLHTAVGYAGSTWRWLYNTSSTAATVRPVAEDGTLGTAVGWRTQITAVGRLREFTIGGTPYVGTVSTETSGYVYDHASATSTVVVAAVAASATAQGTTGNGYQIGYTAFPATAWAPGVMHAAGLLLALTDPRAVEHSVHAAADLAATAASATAQATAPTVETVTALAIDTADATADGGTSALAVSVSEADGPAVASGNAITATVTVAVAGGSATATGDTVTRTTGGDVTLSIDAGTATAGAGILSILAGYSTLVGNATAAGGTATYVDTSVTYGHAEPGQTVSVIETRS